MQENQYFLYHLLLNDKYQDPQNWDQEDAETISRHAEFLDRLGQKGHLVFAGRTGYDPGQPGLFGIALIRAGSLDEARKLMADDPAVLAGIQRAQVHPFRMALSHFANLLDS